MQTPQPLRILIFFYLSESHVWSSDSAGLIDSVTPPDNVFLHHPHLSGQGGGVGWVIKQSYHSLKIDSPSYLSFENMVVSVSTSGQTLLLASVYRPPGSCTHTFLEDFFLLCEFPFIN